LAGLSSAPRDSSLDEVSLAEFLILRREALGDRFPGGATGETSRELLLER
jgi:hypothetical protein